jgi:hypothetical protein
MISDWMRQSLLKLIRFYQITLSPDHSWVKHHYPYGCCQFYPSCSQYAYDSVEKYGALKGIWLGAQRLLKCHPWHRGGFDLVK